MEPKNTTCLHHEAVNERMDGIDGKVDRIKITLFGPTGTNGLTGMIKDAVNSIANLKCKIGDAQEAIIEKALKQGGKVFMRKVHYGIWVPLLIFSLGILGTSGWTAVKTIYAVENSATKEDVQAVQKKAEFNAKDIASITNGMEEVKNEFHEFKKEITEAMKDQKKDQDEAMKDLKKQQEKYLEQIKDLIESKHPTS